MQNSRWFAIHLGHFLSFNNPRPSSLTPYPCQAFSLPSSLVAQAFATPHNPTRVCLLHVLSTTHSLVKTADPEMVFEWRAEAERRMREAGRPGMSEEQVRDFCSRYMPAYRAYLPGLYNSCCGDGPGVVWGGVANETFEGNKFAGVEKTLLIEVGRDRNPVL